MSTLLSTPGGFRPGRFLLIVIFCLLALAATTRAEGGAGVPAAPPELVEAFSKLRTDPPPPELNRNSHFVISDERHHELFRETVTGRGGVYVGVGTDQNYTMAAWSRPEVLVLMDFDMLIPDLHRIYRLAFLNAADADDFVAMWGASDPRLTDLIEAEWPESEARAPITRALKISRGLVHGKLRRLRAYMKAEGIAHFLTDPEQFSWIVGMFKANRVFMVRGDLTADQTVLDIAAAAKAANLPVRVLYVSNAEAYFRPYPPSYLRNMAALPMDDRSVVIRTCGFKPDWSPDPLYEYNVQPGDNFQRWMNTMKAGSVRTLLRGRVKDKVKKISIANAEPPTPKAPKASPSEKSAKGGAR